MEHRYQAFVHSVHHSIGMKIWHCETANINHTKSQNLNISRLVLQLFLPNPLKPGVKSRMKM